MSFNGLAFVVEPRLIWAPVLRELTNRPDGLVCGQAIDFCIYVFVLLLSASGAKLFPMKSSVTETVHVCTLARARSVPSTVMHSEADSRPTKDDTAGMA